MVPEARPVELHWPRVLLIKASAPLCLFSLPDEIRLAGSLSIRHWLQQKPAVARPFQESVFHLWFRETSFPRVNVGRPMQSPLPLIHSMHMQIGNIGWKLLCTQVGIVCRFSAVTVKSLNTWNSKTNFFIWQLSWERTFFKHVLKRIYILYSLFCLRSICFHLMVKIQSASLVWLVMI